MPAKQEEIQPVENNSGMLESEHHSVVSSLHSSSIWRHVSPPQVANAKCRIRRAVARPRTLSLHFILENTKKETKLIPLNTNEKVIYFLI